MNMVIDALTKLGADVKSTASTIPMRILNGICAGEIEIDGSESSQLLTGLLIALPFAEAPSTIHVNNLKSKPYIDLTLKALRSFGIDVEHDDYKTFRIQPQKLDKDVDYTVESDWSGAAFHIVGAAISGTIELVGLDEDSTQADKSIVEAVIGCGAKVNWLNGKLQVSKSSLNAFEFDATDCPDLFPPLAALASCCTGVSKISGVHRLKYKESDRAQTIQKELQNLGIHVAVEGDQLVVHGGKIIGGMVHSHNDHRIAMMCAVLASVSDSPIDILGHTAINKSYPSFYKDLEMMNH
jgi:3-phosphoshikimate 1-carboxyvinyltransferase